MRQRQDKYQTNKTTSISEGQKILGVESLEGVVVREGKRIVFLNLFEELERDRGQSFG